jgi:glutamyl-tRNA reductase
VRNEEVLRRAKEKRYIQHRIKKRKANWIGHSSYRNCLLKHIIRGKIGGRIKMTGRQGRRCRQLLDDLKAKIQYWKLKEEALDHTLWRTCVGRGYRPVIRQTAE